MEAQLTIIAARGIKAADITGTSDGYVKFETKQTKKMKTKVAKPSLNPVWNETFKVKVTPGEVIKFDVFDHDRFSKDDDLGHAKFTVPQLNAGEIYYDILPISEKGYLYVSLTFISGGGQEYHHMNQNDEVLVKFELRKLVNVIKPQNQGYYCVKIATNLTKEQKSNAICFTNSLGLMDSFFFKAKVGEKVKFRVCGFNEGGLLQVASRDFDTGNWLVPDLVDREEFEERIPFKKGGTLFANITCLRGVYHNVFPNQMPMLNQFSGSELNKYELTIFRADNIKAKDFGGTSDAFVKFKPSDSKEKQTYVYYPTTKPQWLQAFRIKAKIGSEIVFKLYDKDKFSKSDSLGDAKFTIPNDIQENVAKGFQLDIDKKGKLFIEIKRIRMISPMFNAPASGYPPQGGNVPGYTLF
ncbi:C2 domain-containing protein [Entamoeba marina]